MVLVLVFYWLWTKKLIWTSLLCFCRHSCFILFHVSWHHFTRSLGNGNEPFQNNVCPWHHAILHRTFESHKCQTARHVASLFGDVFLIFEKIVQTVSTLYPCSFFRYRTSSFEVRLLSGTRLVWKFPWRRPDLLKRKRMGSRVPKTSPSRTWFCCPLL